MSASLRCESARPPQNCSEQAAQRAASILPFAARRLRPPHARDSYSPAAACRLAPPPLPLTGAATLRPGPGPAGPGAGVRGHVTVWANALRSQFGPAAQRVRYSGPAAAAAGAPAVAVAAEGAPACGGHVAGGYFRFSNLFASKAASFGIKGAFPPVAARLSHWSIPPPRPPPKEKPPAAKAATQGQLRHARMAELHDGHC